MRGPHLTLDPYSSLVLALVTVADEHPRTVNDLQERVRACGYACASVKPYGLLQRLMLMHTELLAQPNIKHDVMTSKGLLSREACTAQTRLALRCARASTASSAPQRPIRRCSPQL